MRERRLRIAVADDEPVMRLYFQETLPELGHEVIAASENGHELVEACRAHVPDLVVSDIRMPRMDGLQAAQEINRESLVPVLFISGYHEWLRVAEIERDVVLVYLVKPVGPTEMKLGIELVMQRFEQFQELLRQEPNVENALLDRQQVERAKAFLIRWKDFNDRQAFDYIRRHAGENNQSLVHAAQNILQGYHL